MKVNYLFQVIFGLLFLLACSSNERKNSESTEFDTYQVARKYDNMFSYRSFMDQYPKSYYRDSAYLYGLALKEKWPTPVRGIDTIRLQIVISLPEKWIRDKIKYEIDEKIRAYLKYQFIESVDTIDTTQNLLTVTIRGEALSGKYAPPGSDRGYTSYSGAIIFCDFDLHSGDAHIFGRTVRGLEEIPYSIKSSNITPDDAPFYRAYKNIDIDSEIDNLFKSTFNHPNTVKIDTIFDIEEDINSNIVLMENLIVVASDDYIYAVNRKDGNQKYRSRIFYGNDDRITLTAHGNLILAKTNRKLMALDIDTGEEIWSFRDSDPIIGDSAVCRNGYESFACYHIFDNSVLLKSQQNAKWCRRYQARYLDENIIYYTYDTFSTTKLVKFNLFTKSEIWNVSIPEGHNNLVCSVNFSDKVAFVIVRNEDDRIGIIAISASDGALLWEHYLKIDDDFRADDWEFNPTVRNGSVIFGFWDGFLCAIDITNGSLNWKYKSPLGLAMPPLISEDKVIVFLRSSYNGQIGRYGRQRISTFDANFGNVLWELSDHKIRNLNPSIEEGILHVGWYSIDIENGLILGISANKRIREKGTIYTKQKNMVITYSEEEIY